MASAQDKGTLDPQPLPPLAKPASPATPAKQLFARKKTAAELPTRSVGFYSKGCLAGAAALPVSGETWQVMRLSRNRNWGHPALVEFIEELSERAAQKGWPGLLIGDMSQPLAAQCSTATQAIRSVSMSISGSHPCPTTSSRGKNAKR